MKPRRDKPKSDRPKPDKPIEAPPPTGDPSWHERLRGMLAIAAVALALATPLVPSEGAIREGTYAVLATCWCLLLVGWTLLVLATARSTLRFGWTELIGGGFILWHSLSALTWLGHGNDRQTLNTLWMVVGYGLTVLLLRQVVCHARRARVLIALLLWLATSLAATGYVQYFVTMPALRAEYQRNPERALRERGLSTDPDSPQRLQFENRLNSVEPLATFALTNSLAGFLAPWLIVALAIGLATLREPSLRRTLVGAALLAAFLAGCLLLTKSRTALLATTAGVVLLGLYGRRGGWRIGWRLPAMAASTAVLISLGVVYVGGLDAEVLSEAPKSVLYRLEYWRGAAAMIADHPLFGCGPGNFQEAYAAYKLPQASEMVADPHNFLLEIWATAGTPAILLLLALAAGFTVDLLRVAQRPAPSALHATSEALDLWPTDAILYYGSGLTALVLGFCLAVLGDFPLDTLGNLPIPILWWVGLPLLPLTGWLLKPWIENGDLPLGAVICALLVLAINLLAAGAFTFPGVVLTGLILIPIAMPLAVPATPAGDARSLATTGSWLGRLPADLPLSRAAASGLCAAAFGLAILCLGTQYQPVLNSRLSMRIAMHHLQAGETAAAERAAQAAAAADPWSQDPWRLLAELHFQRFLAQPTEDEWTQFSTAADALLARIPRHHGQHFQRGNWHFLAWQRGQAAGLPANGQSQRLSTALASYRAALVRYPNQALYHGQLAWALQASGDTQAARAAADRAKALDDAMPHADQKLAGRRIADWQPAAASQRLVRPETAEQTVQNLRITSAK